LGDERDDSLHDVPVKVTVTAILQPSQCPFHRDQVIERRDEYRAPRRVSSAATSIERRDEYRAPRRVSSAATSIERVGLNADRLDEQSDGETH
jgi:hypothetical protein